MFSAKWARRLRLLVGLAMLAWPAALGAAPGAATTNRANAVAQEEPAFPEVPQRAPVEPPVVASLSDSCPEPPRDGSISICTTRATPEDLAGIPAATRDMASATAVDREPPDWCFDHINDGTWMTRTAGCRIATDWKAEARRCNPTCAVVGQAFFDVWVYGYTSLTTAEWDHYLQAPIRYAWGTMASGVTFRAEASRGDDACEMEIDSNFEDQPATVGTAPSGSAVWSAPSLAGGGRIWCYVYWQWDWVLPQGPTNPLGIGMGRVRCDQDMLGTPSQGCVFMDYWADLFYERADYPEFVDHLRLAQASGLPGSPSGEELHRLTGALVDRNRSTACPSTYPRPATKQCDEYPFASTYEGAYTGGGQPRTHSWCQIALPGPGSTGPTGFSVCMIDEDDNELAGSDLASFYRNFRILDGDAFNVDVSG